MPIKTKHLPSRFLPYLNIFIEVPFFSVKTSLMATSYDMFTVEWVRLEVTLWKWSTSFRLYSPMKHWVNRNHDLRVAYFRIDDSTYDFLRKLKEQNQVVGMEWNGDRNIGFVLTQIHPREGSDE